jgi:hypothetical protein
MKRLAVVALTVLLAASPQHGNAQVAGAVTLTIDPASASVVLGESQKLSIEVANTANEPSPPLVIHLDIADPEVSKSVDPEDWTSVLSKPIGVVEAGATRTVDWEVQPITSGTFMVYAVALASGVDDLAVSNVTTVEVVDQRSLNPGGILPVAITTPAIVGVLLATRLRRRRVTRET